MGLVSPNSSTFGWLKKLGGGHEYEEVESGSAHNRPKLNEAIQLSRLKKATLVIAKLDRLVRNVHFISQLMESRVEFVATDLPYANKLTIHILAAVAEYEREMISKRTKAALQSAKARGTRLGNPNAAIQAKFASEKAKCAADNFAKKLEPRVKGILAQGITSPSRIAAALNSQDLNTQRGKSWTPAGASNLLIRLKSLSII